MSIPDYLWHPIFVHFPIALLTVATIFYLFATVFPTAALRTRYVHFAEWSLWGGSGLGVLTALLGWLAFNTVDHDDAAHAAMKVHATLALITLGAFGLLTVWSFRQRRSNAGPSWPFTAFMLVAFGFLVATGLRGGELVFHHGLAVSSLPKSDSSAAQGTTPVSSPDTTVDGMHAPHAPHTHKHSHTGEDRLD